MYQRLLQVLLELMLLLRPLSWFIVIVIAIIVGYFYERKLKMLRNEEELQKLTLLRERLEVKALSQQLGIDTNSFKDILGNNAEENVIDKNINV